MKPTFVQSYSITALTLILGALATTPANSQPIKEANDGTNTTVNQNGNQFNIEGGTRNGGNLFHSFDKFNVPTNQTANFLTTPDTRNILGRVTGGNASYINGLIQVIGGNSNLFLMNPAGVMFGPNASLNVPASFSVTTATGIGFDSNNYWFQAMGTNDYSNLVGNPSGYIFNVSNPGAIVNEGNLTLNPGENLTLLGGTVINTGELSTAGGNITIAAVEGGSILRISQPGNLLSLEVNSTTANGEDISGINPLSLAALLTGGETTHATSVIVNDNGDVVLTDSNTLVANTPGDAIVSGNIDVSTTSTSHTSHTSHTPHTSFEGGYNTGSQVNVLGSRVALLNTNINANGTNGGGTVLIGGDFQGNGIVPNSQQTFINNNSIISADAINNGDGGRVIIWSDGITNFAGNISAKGGAISGDGGFVEVSGKQELIFEGNVNVSAAFGNPGTILLDPENVTVGEDNSETEGDNLELSVTENTDSETEIVENNSDVSSSENSDSNTTENTENSETETEGDNSEIPSPENIDSNTTEIADNSETIETETPIDPFAQDENADVTISAENLGELSGDVILIADNDITINEKIETDSSVELKAGRSININADIDTSVGNGNIDLFGNNDEMNFANRSNGKASINQLDGTTLNAGSGRINIQLGNLGEVGDINLGSLTTTGEVFVNANGGNIARVSDNSSINAGSVLFETFGNGGIGLTNAPLRLNVGNLEAVSGSGGIFFDVGNVNIGGVSEDVDGISTGAGGDIILESTGDVTVTENISTDLFIDGKTGGDINLTTNNLFVLNGAEISASTFAKGNGGSVNITAQDTITFDGGDSAQTGSLEVKNGARISSDPSGNGNGGNVKITATDTVLFDGTFKESRTGAFSSVGKGAEGNGGNVTITTRSLEVKNGAQISADTRGTGDAGDITIQTGSLEVKNGSEISAITDGNGNAGDVEITATDTILLDGLSPDGKRRSGVVTAVRKKGEGEAGNITIQTGSLEVKNVAHIASQTFGIGDAGNLEITATDTILFDGVPSNGRSSGAFSSVRVGAEGHAGDVTIKTGSLEFKNGTSISATTDGKGDAGDVEITADTILFDGVVPNGPRRSGVASTVREAGEGKAGNITIKTGSLEVKNGARIGSETFGIGDGGNVEITATDTVLFDGIASNDRSSGAFTSVKPEAEGNAGALTIKTGSLTVTNGAQISSSTEGKGNPGNVEINATETILFDGGGADLTGAFSFVEEVAEANANNSRITITTRSLEVKNGAQISADTRGTGDAGDVIITATDTVLLDQAFPNIRSGVLSSAGPGAVGNAGDITITTRSLEVTNAASISATTDGKGNAGNVIITATDTILFDGALANSRRRSGVATTVRQGGVGDAGNITIKTGSLTVQNGARIASQIFGKGDGGNVEITATDTVLFDGTPSNGRSSGAFTSVRPKAVGDAGDITIKTGSLEVKNTAVIDSETLAKGDAGDVIITAKDTVLFDGVSSTGSRIRITGASSSVRERAVGDAGDVSITTGTLEVTNGARISSITEGKGDAGNIFIATNSLLTINENASILAFTETNGKGGNVIITAPENLNITGNGEITVSSRGGGNAGRIDILSPNITLSDGIDITAFSESTGNAGIINLEGENINIQPNTRILAFTENEGDGGNIIVKATETLNLDADSQLSVETNRSGKAGNIEINTPQLTIGENAQISATVNIGATTKEPGGNITINTNELNIAGELGIFAETEATAEAGSLTLSPYKTNPNLDITFTNDGFISASTSSTGNGGNINISAPETINIQGNGFIAVETTDIGNAGTINIDTKNLTLSDQVAISASTEDKGNAGVININTNNLTLETGTSLTTETNDAGKAGEIEINTRQLTIGENAQISATARVGATNTEAGGNITINATDLFISGRLGIFAETAGESPAGTLNLNPYRNNPNLNITFTEQGLISARTTSIGDGGNINIFAPENINISGEGKISVETTGSGDAGIINIQTENLNLSDQVAISAETNSSGTAGNIVINSQTVNIGEGTEISATAKKEATSTEEGGNITINTNDLLISGRLGIFAETEGKANAGTLTINPYRGDGGMGREGDGEQGNRGVGEFEPNLNITFTENGLISARTLSTGDGGNINIFAPEEINISGEGRITVETEGAGNAGIINIETENLTIAENITISAATSDSGDGGSININPSQTFQLEGQILTETTGAGNGGTITINTGEMTAPNSTISAKSTNSGNAGEINISAENNITTGIITSEANNTTETADGGNISITSEQGEINATQAIQSFSNQGNAGDVTLTAQNNITTNTISSHGQQQGGQITITSETGNIDTSTSNDSILANYSGGGNGGNVTLTAPQGNITTNDIYSFADGDGGQITLQAGGNINIKENSNIISASEPPEEEGERGSGGVGRGGDIILEAGNKINTTTAEIYSGADIGDTGKIDIIAEEAIETGEINLASGFVRDRVTVNENFTLIPIPAEDATQGVAGDITLKSNNSTIDTTAGTINSRSPDGTGNISLNARENITTGKLEASALNQNQPTRGGDVEIISQQGEINATQEIETFSQQGTAGNVNIRAESSVNIENILSQGTQRGGDITIDSRSENSINAQGTLNTFSDAGTAGDVTLTSPGNITISGIRSQGMEQGGEIIVNSEIGNIDSTNGNIDSFSEQGIGGNVTLTAPESVTLANVSSFGATESGDLIIQSRTATVNTDNVTTQAPAGSSGSIIINGTEVGTGDLSSIGTTSAGEINVEATDGSITTYDIEISSDGTIGDLTLRATEDVTTEDINQNAGEGDANANIDSGENQTTGDINQTAENDTNINQTAGDDLNTEDINQTAGNDTNINQTVGDDLNTGDINQTAGNDTNINQTVGEDLNTGDINQTAGNDTNINQTAGDDINTGDINQTAGNDTNINQTAGDDINTGDINQTAENDTNINQTAGEDLNTGDINQTAGNDTNINQTAGGDINTPVINQNPGNESINIQNEGGDTNTPVINQTAGNESINIQNEGINQNTDNTSVITNNNSIINPVINQNNPQNNTNTSNNTTTNFGETNILSTTTTSDIIATATPSNNNQTTNTATAKEQTDSSINNTTDTQQILNIINTVNTNSLTVATGSDQVITMLEQNRIQEYSDYFGEDFNEKLVNTQNVRDILTDMANQTGKESAVVYINSYSDQLQIILYTKSGQPIIKTIPAANRKKLIKVALKLRAQITNPVGRFSNNYLSAAQQLYDWLIAPISAELELANIDTLLFSLDEGLRTFPVAVLHDGSQFLIEKYSLSLIPSVSLMDTNYRPLQDTQVLAMGASEFMKQEPLPAVPIEIQTISEQLWQGTQFLNEEFTRNNLLNERKNYPYPIIHLATHAEFLPGKASNSYIQLWGNEQIKLDQVRELGWSQPAVDLLVLSACRTALGDKNAELGFAGLAVAAGVKSALASLWYVSDEGSLGLMTEFYTHLNNAKIKAEALRQAQLAMLRGEVVIVEGELRGSGARGVVVLPSALGKFENQNLSHPYYWAGFTMVGSPW